MIIPDDIPELEQRHIQDARLHANRYDLIASLNIPSNGVIAEIGVALGDFSRFLISTHNPREFHAFDIFQIHLLETLWGRNTSDVMGRRTHRQFYSDAMIGVESKIIIKEGLSGDTLKTYPDNYFDLIYIDAAHSYEEVKVDAELAVLKIKESGIIVFNDYVLYDPFIKEVYGVVPVVNELVVHQGWRVLGFALQRHMFCDVAIGRISNRVSTD